MNYTDGPAIKNYDNQFKGEMTMKYALSNSRNTTAVYSFQQVAQAQGSVTIARFMKSLGFSDSNNINESYALGG